MSPFKLAAALVLASAAFPKQTLSRPSPCWYLGEELEWAERGLTEARRSYELNPFSPARCRYVRQGRFFLEKFEEVDRWCGGLSFSKEAITAAEATLREAELDKLCEVPLRSEGPSP